MSCAPAVLPPVFWALPLPPPSEAALPVFCGVAPVAPWAVLPPPVLCVPWVVPLPPLGAGVPAGVLPVLPLPGAEAEGAADSAGAPSLPGSSSG